MQEYLPAIEDLHVCNVTRPRAACAAHFPTDISGELSDEGQQGRVEELCMVSMLELHHPAFYTLPITLSDTAPGTRAAAYDMVADTVSVSSKHKQTHSRVYQGRKKGSTVVHRLSLSVEARVRSHVAVQELNRTTVDTELTPDVRLIQPFAHPVHFLIAEAGWVLTDLTKIIWVESGGYHDKESHCHNKHTDDSAGCAPAMGPSTRAQQ